MIAAIWWIRCDLRLNDNPVLQGPLRRVLSSRPLSSIPTCLSAPLPAGKLSCSRGFLLWRLSCALARAIWSYAAARQAVASTLQAHDEGLNPAAGNDVETWLKELIWREFYVASPLSTFVSHGK
jgi:deoxyribodipyrimidine photolyase